MAVLVLKQPQPSTGGSPRPEMRMSVESAPAENWHPIQVQPQGRSNIGYYYKLLVVSPERTRVYLSGLNSGRRISSVSQSATTRKQKGILTMKNLAVLAALVLIGVAIAAASGNLAISAIIYAACAYGLATAWVARRYRVASESNHPVPTWLVRVERLRRYIANEDTADLQIANG